MSDDCFSAVDECLFELCCSRWHNSEQHALESLHQYINERAAAGRPIGGGATSSVVPSSSSSTTTTTTSSSSTGSNQVSAWEKFAVFALLGYQTLAPPTPRQHIYRMIRTYCPDQCSILVEKLDGASESQQLEVLAALQKTYGLVLGNDIAVTVDPMQQLLIQNRMLLRENTALKEQLSEQRSAREFAEAHHELVEQLYRCTALIDVLRKQNAALEQQAANAERLPVTEEGNARRATNADGGEQEDHSIWEARSEALHSRISALVNEQIDERTQHAALVRDLRKEVEKHRKNAHDAATKATSLAQKLLTLEAAQNGLLRCATCATKECETVSVQTVPIDTSAVDCTNEQCIALQAKVQLLTNRLSAATEALQRRL